MSGRPGRHRPPRAAGPLPEHPEPVEPAEALCGAPSPGGGLYCELPPHPPWSGHLWLHSPRHAEDHHTDEQDEQGWRP